MSQPYPSATERPSQLQGTTLFALTLALLAGLVGAYLFKTYFLNAKSPAPPQQPDNSVEIYTLAVNLTDNVQLQPSHFRKVRLSKEEYDRFRGQESKLGAMLAGLNQAVGCVTKEKVKADEPVFETQIFRPEYPVPVSTKLRPGMRAVIVKVPADAAMVQIDDRVDLLCTISNTDFGIGQTATARLVKDAKVIARFNTTRPGALPIPNDPNRTYTLEVTPYRHGLIELAKSLGGVFSLSVSFRPDKSKSVPSMAVELVPDSDPDTDRVTSADLAKLFGIHAASLPERKPVLVVERFSGVSQKGSFRFLGVAQPGQPATGGTPGEFIPLPPIPVTPAGPTTESSISSDDATAYAADNGTSNNMGFRPPTPTGTGCKTCGGGKK